MKIRHIIFLLLCVGLASCGEDRRIEYLEKTAQDRWIHSMMQENYYWHGDIPAEKSLNYFSKVPAFFKSLLSSKDAGYSYIEDLNDVESKKSYGIQFESVRYNDTAYAVRVLYVDSDSPAQTAGLERGDWIIKRNDRYLIRSRVDSLYKGGAITLTLGEYVSGTDENGNPIDTFRDKENGKIDIGSARITANHPILHAGVYSMYGKKIGYLAYNRFTSGNELDADAYNKELRTISNTFSSENLSDFILDLRYNTGGDLRSAQLLGSILAPSQALGKAMCHLRYNANVSTEKDETLLFSNEALGGGANLNLTKLYIITGSTTSGTSDVLINSLKVYINDLTLVGQTTKGNFAGVHAYTNDEYPQYIFYPVDCMIYNANEELPTSGFTPAYTVTESSYGTRNAFGDPNETLLYLTAYLIGNGSMPETR